MRNHLILFFVLVSACSNRKTLPEKYYPSVVGESFCYAGVTAYHETIQYGHFALDTSYPDTIRIYRSHNDSIACVIKDNDFFQDKPGFHYVSLYFKIDSDLHDSYKNGKFESVLDFLFWSVNEKDSLKCTTNESFETMRTLQKIFKGKKIALK